MRRALITAAIATAATALAPAAASAAQPTCVFNTAVARDAIVTLNTDAESAKLTVQRSANNIVFIDANGATLAGAAACAPDTPDVGNTERIIVNDAAAHNSSVFLTLQGGLLAPGFNTPPEAAGAEIEVAVNAGDGTDTLQIDGTDNADNFLLGENGAGDIGANLNNGSEPGALDNDDVLGAGVETATINGRGGDDTISAVGGQAPAGSPLQLAANQLTLDGANQNDTIQGGPGDERFLGGTQDDDLRGGAGADRIDGELDGDTIDGGDGPDDMIGNTGTDVVLYSTRTESVNVTLDDGPNDGGGLDGFGDNAHSDFENVKTGSGSDQITGSFSVNDLTGNAGNDTVNGGGANDKVNGSAGVDRLLGGTGNDKLFGGSENDNLVGGSGNDKLTGNSGKDIFLGKGGLDRLLAKDNQRDKRLNCGKGKNRRESFVKDRKDPKAKSC